MKKFVLLLILLLWGCAPYSKVKADGQPYKVYDEAAEECRREVRNNQTAQSFGMIIPFIGLLFLPTQDQFVKEMKECVNEKGFDYWKKSRKEDADTAQEEERIQG